MLLQAKGCTFHGNNLLNSRSSIPGTFADVLPMALRRSHLQGQRGFAFPFAAGHEALVAVLSAAAPDLLMATRLGAGNPVAPGKGKAGFSFLAALNSPNETDREDGCPEHSGGTDGTDCRRVCRCCFIIAPCLVRRRCVGMPCGRTRLQRICRRLRHCRRQTFRVAAMRAPQPAAGLHTCVVPSRWFAHHVDRTRNRHALALGRGQEDTTRGCARPLHVNRRDHGSSRRLQWQDCGCDYCAPSHSGTLSGLPPSKQGPPQK